MASGEIYDTVITPTTLAFRRHPYCACSKKVSIGQAVRVWYSDWNPGEEIIVCCPACSRDHNPNSPPLPSTQNG